MTGRGQNANPLSEIALAMAMAFFSIMVLALISMGGIVADHAKPAILKSSQHKIIQSTLKEAGIPTNSAAKSALLIFYNKRFLNSSLEVVEPAFWQPEGEPVLAFPPTAKLSEIVTAKTVLPISDITITTLDERWLNRLKELKK